MGCRISDPNGGSVGSVAEWLANLCGETWMVCSIDVYVVVELHC